MAPDRDPVGGGPRNLGERPSVGGVQQGHRPVRADDAHRVQVAVEGGVVDAEQRRRNRSRPAEVDGGEKTDGFVAEFRGDPDRGGVADGLESGLSASGFEGETVTPGLGHEGFQETFAGLGRGDLFPVPQAEQLEGNHGSADGEEQDDQEAGGDQGGDRGLAPGPEPGAADRSSRTGEDGFAAEPALEVLGQRAGRGVAVGRRFREAFQRDGRKLPGDRSRVGWGRILLGRVPEHLGKPVAGEGRIAGQQLVEDRAEAPDIGGDVHGPFPAGDLRGHVRGRADRPCGQRERPFR